MKLVDAFKHKTVFSIEVFPPKTEVGVEHLHQTLENLQGIHPDFISVTLGAGGTGRHDLTVHIADEIQNGLGIPAVAHIPGIYQTKESVDEILDQLEERGISNVLALRGDRIEGLAPTGVFHHAADLTAYIQQRGGFEIVGACYPQVHQESVNAVDDIKHLCEKVDAGADHLISQVFFDNQCFYDFQEKAELSGIEVPIEAGIMPCINKKQIERIAQVAGVPLPHKYVAMLSRYENNPEALRDAGIAYAVDQIADLVSQGVDGIHLYTMNNSDTAQQIWDATKSLFSATVK